MNLKLVKKNYFDTYFVCARCARGTLQNSVPKLKFPCVGHLFDVAFSSLISV